jgi:hypothetical protein
VVALSIPAAESTPRDGIGENQKMEDPTDDAAELRRTMYIAAFWFAATLISGTVTTAILLASGWRPAQLSAFGQASWFTGTGLATIGTVLLAWAGCPVTPRGVAKENAHKTITVRIGIAAVLVGMALASAVELASPARMG